MTAQKRKFILIIAIAFMAISFSVASQSEKSLEQEYPQITDTSPPQSTETSLPEYVKYIFTFIIVISGIIGLSSLIVAGFRYINSTGNPLLLSEAKSQLLSAFWGTIMLLSSYILLQIINPGLTNLTINPIEEIPATEIPSTPINPIPTSDLLTRIKILAERTKEVPEVMKKNAQDIKKVTDECDCKNTKPICACEKSGLQNNLTCTAKTCATGNDSHPCPKKDELKFLQQQIIDQRDVLLYYKNRAGMERNDLKIDIENFINKRIEWYDKEIKANQQLMSEPGLQKDIYERSISFLQERKEWTEEEKQYKNQLMQKIEELEKALAEGDEPPRKLADLTPQCFNNVKDKCQASCKQGENNGCHDREKGCQPDKCSGGNPCPTEKIQQEISKIESLQQKIKGICNEIISIIDSIKKERTPQINF